MPVEKFSIPTNFTLFQSLELLQAIVANQLENYQQQKSKQSVNAHNLNKTYKLLDDLLKYLNEGLYKIERYFKCKESLSNTKGDLELQNKVEDLQILNEDIRLARKDCRNRLKILEKQENGSHGKGLGLTGIWRSYSKKGKSVDNQEEQAAIEAAERIRKARQLDETRRHAEEKKREEEATAQRERMIEVMVKEQVELELNSKLEEEKKRQRVVERQRRIEEDERRKRQDSEKKLMSPPTMKPNASLSRGTRQPSNSDRHSLAVNGRRSLDIRPSGRRSLDANVVEPQRKSLDMQDIGRAAQLAWSQSQQEDLRVQRPPPINVSKNNGSPHRTSNPASPTVRKKYEYVKPVLHRQQIKQPKKARAPAEGIKNVANVEARTTTKRDGDAPKRSHTIPKSNPPRSRSPTPPFEVERESTPGAVPSGASLSPAERRINKVMETLHGVDAHECEQIKNEILVTDEKIHWDDIAGLSRAKNSLKETVVYPFLRPDLFRGLREPIRGMLLFGPPGTGKTMIAKAVATESNSTFFSISASSLLSKYLGESEKLVRALFYMAKRLAPSIIFIDEIDSLLTARSDNENESSRRIKTELLIQWSALSSATSQDNKDSATDARVLVLAATNLPWAIDEAARRRFSRRLYIPLPEYETRLYHLKKLMSRQQNKLSETDYQVIAGMCEGFSGSDITALAKEAAMEPIRDLGDNLMEADFNKIRGVMVKDFEKALQTVKKSVSPTSLQQYQDWAAGFGSTGA